MTALVFIACIVFMLIVAVVSSDDWPHGGEV